MVAIHVMFEEVWTQGCATNFGKQNGLHGSSGIR